MGGSLERRFLLVTGEASGDLHAARLVAALRELGTCRVRGVAGPALRDQAVECLVRAEELAVLGFSEIVGRLPALLRTRRLLLEELARFRPHAVVLVDYPGFNLRLGPALKRRGARLFYYIAPQVWAWHPGRARAMSRWVDRLAVVFPFEEEIFRSAGVMTTFVGHPLMDDPGPELDEAAFRAQVGAGAGARILGLLPGSRPQELERHLGLMLGAARRLRTDRSDLKLVLPLAPGLSPGALPRQTDLPDVHLLEGRTRATQAYATACAVASGTATLETALFGTPHAIVYRTGRLNYAIARRLVRLDHIGLPNIVAGREVAPELVQDQFTVERLAETLAPWLDDPQRRDAQRAGLGLVRERLGPPGASRRAAELLWTLAAA
ncbi:MAG TPA: lipid-A-disaccharide synthase [Candidatus Eisenbacteria bacterium]